MIEKLAAQPELIGKRVKRSYQQTAPIVIELVGPAGSGKTTLLNRLTKLDPSIHCGVRDTRIAYAGFLIKDYLALLPTYLRRYRHSRWFNWQESRSMVYLRAWHGAIQRKAPSGDSVTVLDHGPMYRLASLRTWGPDIVKSENFRKRWNRDFELWASTLDLVVWLDAPNDLLVNRIRHRDQSHECKNLSDRQACDYLDTYRNTYRAMIGELLSRGRPEVLQFETQQRSTNEIANTILATLNRKQEE